LTAVATGNVLSTARNWLLGCSIQRYRQNRYFPGSESTLQSPAGLSSPWPLVAPADLDTDYW